jgi:hypothetical protein
MINPVPVRSNSRLSWEHFEEHFEDGKKIKEVADRYI